MVALIILSTSARFGSTYTILYYTIYNFFFLFKSYLNNKYSDQCGQSFRKLVYGGIILAFLNFLSLHLRTPLLNSGE